jgi:hypothetical protein
MRAFPGFGRTPVLVFESATPITPGLALLLFPAELPASIQEPYYPRRHNTCIGAGKQSQN